MTGLSPELAGLLAATTGVGMMMVFAGVQKNLIEWRRQRRQCPSCGRRIQRRVCDCATPR
jgi:hypothetical protein